MIKDVELSFYLLGDKKIVEINSGAGQGYETDQKLEQIEKVIVGNLLPNIQKQFKPLKKKMVHFVTWENGSVYDDGKIKDWGVLGCKEMNLTPAEFKKWQKSLIKADEKALAKIDKEENYE